MALPDSETEASFKRFEAEGWTARASSYDRLTGQATAAAAAPLLDAAGVAAGTQVLDVASGPGQVSAAAAARGARPVGVELSAGMLAGARAAHPELEFVEGDAEELPFADSAFDAVVGGFALNHLPSPERGVAEARRVLRPGGHAAFSVWDRPERARLIGLLSDLIDRAGVDRAEAIPEGPDGFRFADEGELTALLQGAGLEQVRVQTVELIVPVASVDELWEGLLGGSVRGSSVVLGQPEPVRAAMREDLARLAAEYACDDGSLAVPAVVKIGSARRPETADAPS